MSGAETAEMGVDSMKEDPMLPFLKGGALDEAGRGSSYL